MKMRKIARLGVIAVLSMLLASCGSSTDEATTGFCEDLGEFGNALTEFGTLDEDASEDEVNQAMSDLQRALSELQASAPEGVDTGAVEEAMDALEQELRSMEGGGENLTRRELAALMADTLDLFNHECNIANFGRPG